MEQALDVIFTAMLTGMPSAGVTVQLTSPELSVDIALNDMGADGDLSAEDNIFTGTAMVDTTGLGAGSCFDVIATVTSSEPPAVSPAYELCVTLFDEIQPSGEATLETGDGGSVVADELLVSFQSGVAETRMIEIAESIDATVVGANITLNIYQFRLNTPAVSVAALQNLADFLVAHVEVLSASLNPVDELSEVTPNDTSYGMQAHLPQILSRNSMLTNAQIIALMQKTAKPLPAALKLGPGRLDLFGAVFNGSFEESTPRHWTKVGTVAAVPNVGPNVTPREGKLMGFASTGPAADQVSGQLSQSFTIQPGVTSIPVHFQYAFITEEFDEFVGTQFDDQLAISLQSPSGTTQLAMESVNGSAFSFVGGMNFPGGDDTVGWTGWKTVTMNVPVTAGAANFSVFLSDLGDDIFDSVVVIDDIRFKAPTGPSMAELR